MRTYEILLHLADCHRQRGDEERAIACYQRSLQLQPNSAKTYREFARFWEHRQQEQQALICWTHALTLEPQWATVSEHLTLGKRWLRLKQFQSAESCYQRAIALEPKSALLHRQWGDCLMQVQQWQGAIDAYSCALDLNPDDFQILHQQAACFSQLGDRAAMVQLYLQSISLNPDFAWYYYPLFWQSLKQEQKVLDAIEQFEATLKQSPQALNLYINLGDALSLQNKTEAAIGYYRQGIELMYSRQSGVGLLTFPENNFLF